MHAFDKMNHANLPFSEALANVIVGGVALSMSGFTKNLPQKMFAISGASQVGSLCKPCLFTMCACSHY
jgi:hypothetical protein